MSKEFSDDVDHPKSATADTNLTWTINMDKWEREDFLSFVKCLNFKQLLMVGKIVDNEIDRIEAAWHEHEDDLRRQAEGEDEETRAQEYWG